MPIFEDSGYEIQDQAMFDAVKEVREAMKRRKLRYETHDINPTRQQREKAFYYDVRTAAAKFNVERYGKDGIAFHLGKIGASVQKFFRIPIEKESTMAIGFNERTNEICTLQSTIVAQLARTHPFLATVVENARFDEIRVVQLTLPRNMLPFREAIESTFDQHVKVDGVKFALEWEK